MERRNFLKAIAGCTAGLSLLQLESLLAATGYHERGAYSGPLISTFVNTTCGACPGGCGIRVRLVDGIPVKIDGNPLHPINRGGLCPVGASALGLLVHPDRLREPLRRSGPRGSGQFSPISWAEAEALLDEELQKLRQSGHPEGLLFLDSRKEGPGLELSRKFTADFGSPNFYHDFDPGQKIAAEIWGGGAPELGYDLENARMVFCFGHPIFEGGRNPVYFAGLRGRMLNRPEGEKGRFVVIDSRLSVSASKAENWVPIRPGTHGLLALGMIYLIIKEQLYDEQLLQRCTDGFADETDRRGVTVDGFKSFVLKNYYPALVSKSTAVPVDQIITLARTFATTPGAVALPGAGVDGNTDGIYQRWAIMALNVLTGRVGQSGGLGTLRPGPFAKPGEIKNSAHPVVAPTTGEFPYLDGAGAIESLPEKILAETPYPIRLAILQNVNPVYNSPRADRFRQALQNIPFSVAITPLPTETSLLADLILPDCTFLEKLDLVIPDADFAYPVAGLQQPVVKPLYQSRQADGMILALGQRLLGDDWQEAPDIETFIKEKAQEIHQRNTGTLFSEQFKVSFSSLLAERGWRREEFRDFDEFWQQYRTTGGWWDPLGLPETGQDRFPSESGKFYFSSDPLQEKFAGSAESLESLLGQGGLSVGRNSGVMLGSYRNSTPHGERYPLSLYLIELMTMRGAGGHLDKMADMVGFYENVKWQSWVELNQETAAELAVTDGQMVWVESARGKQRLLLRVNSGLVPHTAAVPGGLGHHGSKIFGDNVNEIISTARDCFTGVSARAETRVRVYPAT